MSITIPLEANPTCGIKVDASIIAEPFRNEIRQRVQSLKDSGIEAPLLVGLLANDDPAAKQYAEWTGKACRNDGIRYELRIINDPLSIEGALQSANDDPAVHGIIVYYPIFGNQKESYSGTSYDDYIRDTISYTCDVEGLCYLYRSNLYRNVRYLDPPNNSIKCIVPCTALSVVKILEACPNVYQQQQSTTSLNNYSSSTNKSVKPNTIITIINRSEIVGRPLAAMLANDGATVYSIDLHSIYIFTNGTLQQSTDIVTAEECVKKSSVVITGVPTKSYRLPTEWIQPNTVVVNVASYKNVDETSLLQIPGVIYIPQVGKVTVAMLERNVIRLFDQFHHPNVLSLRQQQHRRQFNTTANSHTSDQPYLLQSNDSTEQAQDVKQKMGSTSSLVDTVVKHGPFILSIYTAIAITAVLAVQWKKVQK